MNLINQIKINLNERFAVSQFFLSAESDFLADHFPDTPILPGLVMLEIAVQTAAAWMTENAEKRERVDFDIDFLEQLYITRPVVPNELLSMRVSVTDLSTDRMSGFFGAEARVTDERAMRARFSLASVKNR